MFRKNRCYIIAEIGGNFTDFDTAKLLIDQVAACGADAVKLQTYRADTLSSKTAVFDQENTGVCSQYEYFKKYEISEELHKKIFSYAEEKGLDCFSTPAHRSDVEMLERLNVKAYKIGADDAVNLPLLKEVARIGKPVILSTGMCTLKEVHEAVDAVLSTGNRNLAVLHTVGNYPTAPKEVNLRVIETFKREFPDLVIGYSDHTLDVFSCICAAVMGAEIIEKHFTYDKKADGPDHMLSATKDELNYMIDRIREFEVMRGNGIKAPIGNEIIDRNLSRKSLITISSIKKGERFSKDNVDCKRPGTGIAPQYMEMIVGRRAAKDLAEDQILSWEDII